MPYPAFSRMIASSNLPSALMCSSRTTTPSRCMRLARRGYSGATRSLNRGPWGSPKAVCSGCLGRTCCRTTCGICCVVGGFSLALRTGADGLSGSGVCAGSGFSGSGTGVFGGVGGGLGFCAGWGAGANVCSSNGFERISWAGSGALLTGDDTSTK